MTNWNDNTERRVDRMLASLLALVIILVWLGLAAYSVDAAPDTAGVQVVQHYNAPAGDPEARYQWVLTSSDGCEREYLDNGYLGLEPNSGIAVFNMCERSW